jgi:hypothetical protein
MNRVMGNSTTKEEENYVIVETGILALGLADRLHCILWT